MDEYLEPKLIALYSHGQTQYSIEQKLFEGDWLGSYNSLVNRIAIDLLGKATDLVVSVQVMYSTSNVHRPLGKLEFLMKPKVDSHSTSNVLNNLFNLSGNT